MIEFEIDGVPISSIEDWDSYLKGKSRAEQEAILSAGLAADSHVPCFNSSKNDGVTLLEYARQHKASYTLLEATLHA